MFVIKAAISNLAIITVTAVVVSKFPSAGPPKAGSGPGENIFFLPPSCGGRSRNLYTKLEITDSHLQSNLGLFRNG